MNVKGDLLVPVQYVTEGNKLSSEEIDLLSNIGMEWSKTDYKWMMIYNSAVSYYDDHGVLLVPSRYTTDDDINLGTWIKHQRERNRGRKITTAEESLLNKIGMIWNLKER